MDKEGDERLAGRVDVEQRVTRAAQDAVQYHLVVANHAYLRGRTFAAVLLFEQVHNGVNSRHFGTLSRVVNAFCSRSPRACLSLVSIIKCHLAWRAPATAQPFNPRPLWVILKLNADWVVLSACNTIAGDKPGAEALSGLARAFFYAGA